MGFASDKPVLGNQMRKGGMITRPAAKGPKPKLGNQAKFGSLNKGTSSLAGQPNAKLGRKSHSASVNPDGGRNHTTPRFR